jgi:1,4-alpha-glucan branching enzyme
MASTTPISSFQLEEIRCRSLNFNTTRIHQMPIGAEIERDGKVRFRVWAPAAESLALSIEGSDQTIPFLGKPGGWHGFQMERSCLICLPLSASRCTWAERSH